jgi:hypothetical protein
MNGRSRATTRVLNRHTPNHVDDMNVDKNNDDLAMEKATFWRTADESSDLGFENKTERIWT